MLSILHLTLDGLECIVENLVRNGLLAIVHQVVHKLRHFLVVEDWIGKDHTLLWFCFSHFVVLNLKFLLGAVFSYVFNAHS